MDTDRNARRRRELAELSEQGMELVRELHARAQTASTAKELLALAQAFEEVADSVCNSIELEAKLARESRRETIRPRGEAAAQPSDRPPPLQPRRRPPPGVH